jgi:hypothetical protein
MNDTNTNQSASKYQLCKESGWPDPLGIADVKPISHTWGNVAGYSLALDLFQWREAFYSAYADNPKFKEQEAATYVLSMMESAFKAMADKGSDSAVAVALLESLSVLVVKALEHQPNAEIIERIRAESVQHHEEESKEAQGHALDLRKMETRK